MTCITKYKQKAAYPEFLFIQILPLMLCFIAPKTTVLNQVSLMIINVKIALISHWNDISIIPLGEMCFLEESYKQMHKIQILKKLRAPSIWNHRVCL